MFIGLVLINFLNLLLLQWSKMSFWSKFSRRSLPLVSGTLLTYLANLRHMFYAWYTSFFFQFVPYVNFVLQRYFLLVAVNFALFLLQLIFIWEKLSCQGQKILLPRSCYAQNTAKKTSENISVHIGYKSQRQGFEKLSSNSFW